MQWMQKNWQILNLNRCCFTILISLFFLPALFSQTGKPIFRKLGTEADNFPEERITAIFQGKYKLMWFGTARGLLRYDGASVKRYRHDPDDDTSITAGSIHVIYEDSQERFWVGSSGGLNLLDRRTGAFSRFLHNPENPQSLSGNNIWSILSDQDGGLWVGTDQGLDLMKDGRIFHYGKEQGLPNQGIASLARDENGVLWVGARKTGLYFLLPEKQRFEALNHADIKEIRTLLCDSRNRLWIGTKENGLAWLEDGLFHFMRDDPQYGAILGSDRISALDLDDKENLWIGGNQGLGRLNLNTQKLLHYQSDEANPMGLRNSRIDAIFHSSDNLLWTATALNGLDILDPNTENLLYLNLEGKEVWSIFKDSSQRLWVGVYNGLARIEPGQQAPQWSFSGKKIYFVAEHGDTFYCGTPNAFFELNPKTGEPVGDPVLTGTIFWRFLATGEDLIWLGTQEGLVKYNPKTGQSCHIKADEPGSPYHLSHHLVTCLAQDRAGFLWVGTFGGGLNRLNPDTDEITHYLPGTPDGLSAGHVLDLAIDEDDNIWIATLSGGLNLLNPNTGVFKRFTVKEGFPDNSIAATTYDGQGGLWAKTGLGVARVNIADHSWHFYREMDGFQEGAGIPGSRFTDPKTGRVYLGGIEGVTSFNPKDVYVPSKPPLIFTGFKRDNKETAHLILPGETARVEPEDKTFSLEFSVLDYRSSDNIKFAYLREGLDKDWVDSQVKGLVNYTRYLSYGGRSTLKIRGQSGYGVKNEAMVHLKAYPPFWVKSLPFTIPLAFLLLIWLTWTAIAARERRKRIRLEAQARMAEERAKLAENRQRIEARERMLQEEYNRVIQEHLEQVSTEIANELHDGPLSSLTGMTYRLEAIGRDLKDQNQKKLISSLAQQALPEVCSSLRDVCGDLLAPDFEAGLDVEMDAYADVMEKRCPGLAIHRELDEPDRLSPEQMACLFRIYRTLLKNVDKHAKATQVSLQLKVSQENIFMEIKDNGVGFTVPENWEMFKKNKHYGMYMARYFAESLGGCLEVTSQLGAGTTVRVTAPVMG